MGQAVLSALLGGSAWVLVLTGFALIAAGSLDGPKRGCWSMGIFVYCRHRCLPCWELARGSRHPARGDHMILATIGLFLSGLHTGVFLGLFTFALWQNSR